MTGEQSRLLKVGDKVRWQKDQAGPWYGHRNELGRSNREVG
jgi:hypothetical protein